MAIVYDDAPISPKKSRIVYDEPVDSGREVMNKPGTPNYEKEFGVKRTLARDVVKSAESIPSKLVDVGKRAVENFSFNPLTRMRDAAEGAANIVTGALSAVPAMFSGDPEQTREDLTYQPRHEGGKIAPEAMGAVMGPTGELIKGGSEAVGEATDINPARVQAVAESAMLAVPAAKGLRGKPQVPKLAETPAEVMRQTGLKVPPSQLDPATGKPAGGIVGRTLEKVAGPEMTPVLRQKNTVAANKKAAKSIGAPEGARLDKTTFDKLRAPENKAYGALANKIGKMAPDTQFQQDLAAVSADTLVRDAGITKLIDDFSALRETNAQTVLNTIRDLRKQGYLELNKNYASANPQLGKARLKIADLFDDLLARTASEYGIDPKTTNAYLAARQKLAKISTVENATSGGIISAEELAHMRDNGVPLTGELAELAYAGEHAPGVMGKRPQNAPEPPVSSSLLAPIRAGAARLVASDQYQNTIAGKGPGLHPDVPIRPDAPPPSGGIPLPAAPVRPSAPAAPNYGPMPPQLTLADELGVRSGPEGGVPFEQTTPHPLAEQLAGDLQLRENAPVRPGARTDIASDLETVPWDAEASIDGPFAYGNPAIPFREPPAIEPVVGARQLLEGQRGSGYQGISHFQLADELAPAVERAPEPPPTVPEPTTPSTADLASQLGIEVVPSAKRPGFFEVRGPGEAVGVAVESAEGAMGLVDQLIGDLLDEGAFESQPTRQPFSPAPVVPRGRFGGQGEASQLPGIEVQETQAPRAPRKATGEEMTVESDKGALILRPSGDTMRVRYAKTKEPGKGEGTKLYVKAIDDVEAQGKKFASDTIVSESAARVYDKLEKMGYEVVRNEAEFDPKAKTWTSKVSTQPVFEVRSPQSKVKRSGTG